MLHSAFYLTILSFFFFFLSSNYPGFNNLFLFLGPHSVDLGVGGAVLLCDRYRKQPLPAELLVCREHSQVPSGVVHKAEEPKDGGREGSAWHCVVPGEGQEGFLKGGDF